ncbi:complexin-3-like [Sphaerodactylus townsendi]|uniref:complexin-3-like n=1 Tax=Sphaerodactylus townsendi TaxID=933632 RepID=UPI002026E945|nr:complexin-3-like [Sphaerodactylus townsendi]XP_048366598.1 complexin-3-like [Sphaerodactylus townsendi]
MGSTTKSACGVPARQLLCCISGDFPREKDSSVPQCPSKNPPQWNFSPKQKSNRDAVFVQKKAERAAMRAHLREKYQLPRSRKDKKQVEAAGQKVTLPQDLLAIVKSKAPSEAGSLFPSLDFSSFRMTAQNAVQSLQQPIQCPIM